MFLSYAREDSARASFVNDQLEALGLSVFFDTEGIDSGEEFPIIIDRAVKGAKCVLGLWSQAALEKRWVRIESRIGLDQRKLVAAVIDGTRPDQLPAEFYNVNIEDLSSFSGQPNHPGWQRILRSIGKLKTYDGTGGVTHSVQYEGSIDESGGAVTGQWQAGENRGPFRMVRR